MPRKPTKRPTGRPPHKPTPVSRRKVSIAAGGGMLHEQIALALGITRETLRKWYSHELSVVASQRRMQVIESQYQAAMKKGSTSAAKVYLNNEPEFEIPPAPEGEPVPAAEAAPARVVKLGKKEKADADATTAADGTEWSNLLPKPGAPLQ